MSAARPTVRELTAPAAGGVAVVRVEGEGAEALVARLLPGGELPVLGRAVLARLVDAEGDLLDEALVVATAPTAVELHLHGAPPVVARVLRELGGAPGPPPPTTLEEAARELLACAPSEACARTLLDQAEGALRAALAELPALSRARQDAALASLVERGRVALHLVSPPRVVLAGPSNAGKSTLFNLLVGEERALVDAERGTTRDALRAPARLGAWAVELVDTAGEREVLEETGAARVERAGQALGRRRRAEASWVAWLTPDPDEVDPDLPGGVAWERFTSRADELDPVTRARAPRPLSCHADPAAARAALADAVRTALRLPAEPWSPGAPVPFTEELHAALARAAAAGPQERAALLAALPPDGGW